MIDFSIEDLRVSLYLLLSIDFTGLGWVGLGWVWLVLGILYLSIYGYSIM